jgi:hypothetical protein
MTDRQTDGQTDWLDPHYKMYLAAAHKDSMSVPAQLIFATTNSLEESFSQSRYALFVKNFSIYTEMNYDGFTRPYSDLDQSAYVTPRS